MINMNKIKFICVDFQKDFSSKTGKAYKLRPSVDFVKRTLVPFFKKHNIKIAEIISDYRAPRSGSTRICRPGESGFESEIPNDIKSENIWIKSMNSPLWTRVNCGIAEKEPGIPFQDSNGFEKWLNNTIGNPNEVEEVILFGLTIDCCVLSTAQELCWRGYNVTILEEAVDTYSGNQEEKKWILNNVPLRNWAKTIDWRSLQGKL